MTLLAAYPPKPREVEAEVNETATLMATVLRLQHYPPEKALLALTLAADQIATNRENIEVLRMRAGLRGANVAHELLAAEGGQFSAEQFAERLKMSRETVNQWRKNGQIVGWKRGARNYSYPAWQIHRGALLPGLEAVRDALGFKPTEALEITDYLLSESEELGERPLELLRRGEVEAVVEHAGRYGDIGA